MHTLLYHARITVLYTKKVSHCCTIVSYTHCNMYKEGDYYVMCTLLYVYKEGSPLPYHAHQV